MVIETKNIKFDHILIVDDNVIDLFIAKKVLKLAGYNEKIATSSSISHALFILEESLQENNSIPSLIFLDIFLPEHDVFYFLEKFDVLYAGIELEPSVIICSASCDLDLKANLVSHKSVIDYIDKPLMSEHISSLIESKTITANLVNMKK